MKGLILSIAMLAGIPALAAEVEVAADAASAFVNETMTKAQDMLKIKDETDRNRQLCGLFGERIGSQQISDRWLGTFASLKREEIAVKQFTGIVPSIMMTKSITILGANGKNGNFKVDDLSVDRGNQVYAVGVTVKSGKNSYRALAIVEKQNAGFAVTDVEFNDLSAVDYQGKEYQKFLNRQFSKDPNNSKPVTKLIENIISQEDYVACP